MRVDWYGQAAFRLSGQDGTVFIDPFGDLVADGGPRHAVRLPADRGRRRRPAARHARALRSQRRRDHRRAIRRSCARPPGASSRPSARWSRSPPSTTRPPAPSAGPTRSSCSRSTESASLTSATSARRSLRDEQADAIGQVDLVFLPVGDGPTIGAEQAAAIARARRARAGSCRCTTARTASASSSRPMPSSSRCPHVDTLVGDRLRHRRAADGGRPGRGRPRGSVGSPSGGAGVGRSAVAVSLGGRARRRAPAPRVRLAAGPADSRGARPTPDRRPDSHASRIVST